MFKYNPTIIKLIKLKTYGRVGDRLRASNKSVAEIVRNLLQVSHRKIVVVMNDMIPRGFGGALQIKNKYSRINYSYFWSLQNHTHLNADVTIQKKFSLRRMHNLGIDDRSGRNVLELEYTKSSYLSNKSGVKLAQNSSLSRLRLLHP